MKIIELLNKIANGEELPKKIKFENNVYILNKQRCRYELENEPWCFLSFDTNKLTVDVEIIEDEIDIQGIKELELVDKDDTIKYKNENGIYTIRVIDIDMMCKIDELVQAVKQVHSEIEKMKEDNQ